MKTAGIVILVVIILGIAIFVIKSRKSIAKEQRQNYCINIFMPLTENKDFNPQDLMNSFKQMWGMDIVCAQPTGENSEKGAAKKYMVGNGPDKNNLFITWARDPLKKEMIELLVKSSEAGFTNNEPISKDDVISLRNHKAYFQIEYILGPTAAKERVLFTAKLLLTLNKMYSACGFVNASAQSYIPSARIGTDLFKNKDLPISDVFLLFVNIQMVSDGQQIELHTHGMDQFWLPDIKMQFSDKNNFNSNYDVIRNAAVYMIEKGHAMNISDTASLAEDGKIFKVTEVKEERDHPFGYYGVIGLKRQ